jgi:hypothetical protein
MIVCYTTMGRCFPFRPVGMLDDFPGNCSNFKFPFTADSLSRVTPLTSSVSAR